MFFDTENLSFKLLDVICLHQKNINILNVNRQFDALSYRFSADTDICIDDKKHHLTDGDICYIPAHLTYRRIAAKDDMIVIHFDTQNHNFGTFEYLQIEKADTIRLLFTQIFECWNNKAPGYYYKCTALLNLILAECVKNVQPAKVTHTPIRASIDYLEANYTNPHLTISEISAKSYMSEVYFRRLFKESYGISPAKYIINLRIKKAINLMNTEYYTLQEIAALSGYHDYSYFSSEFKRMTGLSPSQYLHKKSSI